VQAPGRPTAVLATHRQPAATRRTAGPTTRDAANATALGSAALPFTGSDTRLLLAVASVLLITGSGLLLRASVLGARHRPS
jgi:hypothetical protein